MGPPLHCSRNCQWISKFIRTDVAYCITLMQKHKVLNTCRTPTLPPYYSFQTRLFLYLESSVKLRAACAASKSWHMRRMGPWITVSGLFCFFRSSFCDAYFSRWRVRHFVHFVARPLAPNASHRRKFLQPLHHLIMRPFFAMTQTVMSQLVQSPLFCFGILAIRPLSSRFDGVDRCSSSACWTVMNRLISPDVFVWDAVVSNSSVSSSCLEFTLHVLLCFADALPRRHVLLHITQFPVALKPDDDDEDKDAFPPTRTCCCFG